MINNYGVSRLIRISGQKFTLLNGFKISNISEFVNVVKPPTPSNSGDVEKLVAYTNKHSDFTFQKVCPPLYGPNYSTARYTGIPANEPDHIADFHFIGIMRTVDDILIAKYKGYIAGTWGTVLPKK